MQPALCAGAVVVVVVVVTVSVQCKAVLDAELLRKFCKLKFFWEDHFYYPYQPHVCCLFWYEWPAFFTYSCLSMNKSR